MSKICAGKPKGYRYIKKAGHCMSPCKKPAYRSKKSPYHCKMPSRKNRRKCPKGYKRSKSGSCVTKYKLLTYKSR
jgi:hypothetical protein